jgi:hypothetical protein
MLIRVWPEWPSHELPAESGLMGSQRALSPDESRSDHSKSRKRATSLEETQIVFL